MTEIQVYNDTADDGVPSDTQPALLVTSGTYDLSAEKANDAGNVIAIPIDLDGDRVSEISYYGSEGNKRHELILNQDYTLSNDTYTLTSAFLQTIKAGNSSIKFIMAYGQILNFDLTVIDSSGI